MLDPLSASGALRRWDTQSTAPQSSPWVRGQVCKSVGDGGAKDVGKEWELWQARLPGRATGTWRGERGGFEACVGQAGHLTASGRCARCAASCAMRWRGRRAPLRLPWRVTSGSPLLCRGPLALRGSSVRARSVADNGPWQHSVA